MVEALFRYVPRRLDNILRPIDRALRVSCYPAVLLAQNLLVRLTRMEGVTRTGSARVLVAGADSWAYDLPLRLFSSRPDQSVIGTVPLWRLNSTLENMERDFDVVVAYVDRIAARLFFPPTYLRIPQWVDTGRALPDDPASLLRSSESLRQDIRVTRKKGFETSVSRRLDDFEEFYHSMYTPFIRARHGTAARLRNEITLRNCFRRGGLVWLARGSERLAGLVFERAEDTLGLRAYATRDDYAGLTKQGIPRFVSAASTLYFHAISEAIQDGCHFLDFGGCRACLTDGLLFYKKKWGVRVHIRPANLFYTLIRWSAWNPAVATFLSDLPLLHQNGNRLTAITAMPLAQTATQADADKVYRALHVPGVDEFVMVNACGWAADIVPPPSTVLIGGSPLPAQLLAR
jgi:hypothetical protein